jgi:lysophospholipid acyltransferase (LPLAT)-like uncharacterized protein
VTTASPPAAPASSSAHRGAGTPGVIRAVAPDVVASAVRVLGATLRFTAAGLEDLGAFWDAQRPLIYVVWHGRMLMMPWINARLRRTARARAVTVLASRSRDGELVARYVERFGLASVRGSSSRGGASALRALAASLKAGDDVALVPDGPRGPARHLSPGIVKLAAMTDAPIVPVGFSARPARILRTWDRCLVPLPFSRAAAVFGAPLAIDKTRDRESARSAIESALDAVTDTADRLVGRL